MEYNKLTNEELISILKEKDQYIQNIEKSNQLLKKETSYLIDSINNINITIQNKNDIDLESLKIDNEEIDNYKDVDYIDRQVADMIDINNNMGDEIYELKKSIFRSYIFKLNEHIDNNIPYEIEDFYISEFLSTDLDSNRQYALNFVIPLMQKLFEKLDLQTIYYLYPDDNSFLHTVSSMDKDEITFSLFNIILSENNFMRTYKNKDNSQKLQSLENQFGKNIMINYEKDILNKQIDIKENNNISTIKRL